MQVLIVGDGVGNEERVLPTRSFLEVKENQRILLKNVNLNSFELLFFGGGRYSQGSPLGNAYSDHAQVNSSSTIITDVDGGVPVSQMQRISHSGYDLTNKSQQLMIQLGLDSKFLCIYHSYSHGEKFKRISNMQVPCRLI